MSERKTPDLAVWYGSMPESNGKENWAAILYDKNENGLSGGISGGMGLEGFASAVIEKALLEIGG